ncbi:multicopper oxidase, partial [Mucor lusitanicus]
MLLFHLVYLLASFVIQSTVAQTHPGRSQTVRSYEFNVTQRSINPDCSDHVSPVFLINNQMPGPKITAVQGDVVRVLIRNQLSPMPLPDDHRHNVAIHFHGIRQYGSVHSDGVPYLTQMPIKPGQEYVHEFRVVNQAGTYFYHAHVGMQEERTSLLLKAGPYTYHDERTLLLSEWWHRPHMEFESFLMGPNILINGHTLHNARKAVVAQCGGYELIPVKPNQTYRFRVIGATAFRTLGFAIAHHNLTIIEVDGELTKPYTVSQEVAPGQRFSVLLHTDQKPDDYSIQIVRRWSDNVARPTNAGRSDDHGSRGVVRLKKPIVLEPPAIKAHFDKAEDEAPHWLWSSIEPLYGVDPVIYKPATKTIKLRSVDRRMPDNTVRWLIKSNRRQVPGLYDTITADGYDRNLGTYPISYFDIVDIIAHGQGEYVHERDADIQNVKNPLHKDITMIYPFVDPSLFEKNGTKVEEPDNPGVWAVHCHNTAHMMMA